MCAVKDKLIRLHDRDYARLQMIAKFRGETEMNVIRTALGHYLSEQEEEKSQYEREKETKRTRRMLTRKPSTGLNLQSRSDEPAVTVPPPQIIVMQQPAPATTPVAAAQRTEDVARLASWVAAATDYFEEVKRMQTAVDVIRASTTDEVEREKIATALDREVAARKRDHEAEKPSFASSPLAWLKRLATGDAA